MTQDEQKMWSSHQPALLACIGATHADVLEIGVGDFSTPALHALCGSMKRRLISIEGDKGWLSKFSGIFNSPHHTFYLRDKIGEEFTRVNYSVVFIDHSPGGQNRADAFKIFLPISDYLVVHDYEKDNEEFIAPIIRDFEPFHHITKFQNPPTLIASLKRQIPESILCM